MTKSGSSVVIVLTVMLTEDFSGLDFKKQVIEFDIVSCLCIPLKNIVVGVFLISGGYICICVQETNRA